MNMKQCKKCNKIKSMDLFYKQKDRKDGHRSHCIECTKKYSHKFYLENKESILINSKEYHQSHREHKQQKGREWYKKNKVKHKEKCKRWAESNPEKIKDKYRKRRARELQAEGTFTESDIIRQYKSQKGLCWWCLIPVEYSKHHNDHLIPLSKGGTNWPNNIVTSCAECNFKKNNKMPYEFVRRLL